MSKTAAFVAAFLVAWGSTQGVAQEAIREMSVTPNAATPSLDDQPCTFKIQDLQVLVTPSMGFSYNDNINISDKSQLDDFILTPLLSSRGFYPLTERNFLTFDVGVGYDEYLQHDRYSGVRLTSGSGVNFDMGVGDFQINLHDRFSYFNDAAGQAAIAGNGEYGVANNTVGVLTMWDLGDITSSVGYDHQNYMSTSGTAQQFESQDHESELLLGRTGFRIRPDLVAGLEATGSFTRYDKNILNNNTGYSLGAYVEFQTGDLMIQPRGGYASYQFDHTSPFVQTDSMDSWYADLTASYRITGAIETSLSVGHEIRLGIQSDAIETYYVTPQVHWGIIEKGTLNFGLSYENGKQGVGNRFGNLSETYNYISPNVGFTYQITKRLSGALNYRATFRTSDVGSRDYTQNLVSLVLTYPLQ